MSKILQKSEFAPELWRKWIATGCYTYAMQWQINEFAFVGDFIGKRVTAYASDETLINVLIEELEFLDYTIQEVEVDEVAPNGYFKIYLMRYELTGHYHFLREDVNGQWSHKYPNELPVNYDSIGQVITNPDDMVDAPYYGWTFLIGKK